jgi:translation elongation factor EF-Ts
MLSLAVSLVWAQRAAKLSTICQILESSAKVKDGHVVKIRGRLVHSRRHGLKVVDMKGKMCWVNALGISIPASLPIDLRREEVAGPILAKLRKMFDASINQPKELEITAKVVKGECEQGFCDLELVTLDMKEVAEQK